MKVKTDVLLKRLQQENTLADFLRHNESELTVPAFSHQIMQLCAIRNIPPELLDELKRLEHAQNERRRYHGEYLEYHESATDGIVECLSSEEEYLQSCRRQELYRAMLRLPARQMRRIYAHFFLQLSLTEIARVEKVSIAAISSSITQGILHLRRYLSKD